MKLVWFAMSGACGEEPADIRLQRSKFCFDSRYNSNSTNRMCRQTANKQHCSLNYNFRFRDKFIQRLNVITIKHIARDNKRIKEFLVQSVFNRQLRYRSTWYSRLNNMWDQFYWLSKFDVRCRKKNGSAMNLDPFVYKQITGSRSAIFDHDYLYRLWFNCI